MKMSNDTNSKDNQNEKVDEDERRSRFVVSVDDLEIVTPEEQEKNSEK